ncbi:histidine kinase-, DNA gyrase B-, and HSP90-like ATPase family protein [Tanacetum coccineum]
MSSSRKSPHDYLRRYRRAILEPWRQSHLLPPSPPVSPNRSPSNSPTITNSLSSPSPPQNPFQNQIVDELNELHHLSNLIDINLQRAIDATTQTPPSSPLILPATLEQVQNADENAYPCDVEPALTFIHQETGVTLLSNDEGFSVESMKALCDDVFKSKGKELSGDRYLDQKGIGFKSVFCVTDAPEIHSNEFNIKFKKSDGLPTVVPPCDVNMFRKLVDADSDPMDEERWNTCILLPTENDNFTHAFLNWRILSLYPQALLFLHRLKCVKYINLVKGVNLVMRKEVVGDGIVNIFHHYGKTTWFVKSSKLTADQIRHDVQTTEISMALLLDDSDNGNYMLKLDEPKAFAFIRPLNMYGLNFIIQADFIVSSIGEEVDVDSPWNQWLLSEFPNLFVSAERSFCSLPCFKENQAKGVSNFMSFVPLEGEVHGALSSLPNMIISKLRVSNCLLIEGDDNEWVCPCKVVRNWTEQIRSLLPDSLIREHLDVGYLSKYTVIKDSLARALGIEDCGPKFLVQAMTSLCQAGSLKSMGLSWLSSWLNILFLMLVNETEYDIISSLSHLLFIPLLDGNYASISEGAIWLLTGEDDFAMFGKLYLSLKLRIVDPDLFSDHVENITQMLYKVGVQPLSAHEVIKVHILPAICDEKVMAEHTEVMIECLSFIMFHLESSCPNCLVEKEHILSQLNNNAYISTNHGFKRLVDVPIHFSKEFGSPIDMSKLVGGTNMNWFEVDIGYLKHPVCKSSPKGLKQWRKFLTKLGVTDFVRIVNSEKGAKGISGTSRKHMMFDDDWDSQELMHLLSHVSSSHDKEKSKYLLKVLDTLWADYFSDKPFISYIIRILHGVQWLVSNMDDQLHYPKDLFHNCKTVREVLGGSAPYAVPKVNNLKFVNDIGLKNTITLDDALSILDVWRRSKKSFRASISQMSKFYTYLLNEMSTSKQKIVKNLRSQAFIFVPYSFGPADEVVSGLFVSPMGVYWHDSLISLMEQTKSTHPQYDQRLSHRPFSRMLCNVYPGLKYFFVNEFGVAENLSHLSYLQPLLRLSNECLPSQASKTVFQIFQKWSDGLVSNEIDYLKKSLQEKNMRILPTAQNKWVSLHRSFGLICWCDDEQLRKEFMNLKNVDFLHFGELTTEEKQMLRDKVSVLFCKLGIPSLSEVVTREAIYDNVRDNTFLTYFINWVLPYAQRYVYSFHPKEYSEFKNLKIVVVEKLSYKNVIKKFGIESNKRLECSCLLQDNILHATSDSVSDPHSLFMELSRFLVAGVPELPLANFLLMIVRTKSSSKEEKMQLFSTNKQKLLKLPSEESEWSMFKESEEKMQLVSISSLEEGKLTPTTNFCFSLDVSSPPNSTSKKFRKRSRRKTAPCLEDASKTNEVHSDQTRHDEVLKDQSSSRIYRNILSSVMNDGFNSNEREPEKPGVRWVKKVNKFRLGCDFVAEDEGNGNEEESAKKIIECIRQEEFGLDPNISAIGEDGVLKKLNTSLGRGLHCLSRELYFQDSHFLLELVRNADENAYPCDVEPTLTFILQKTGVIVLTNDQGFSVETIKALCKESSLSKKESSAECIGKKGVGFKSVFQVTDAPEIHSNGFHVKFDISDGPIGFVLPKIVPLFDVDLHCKLVSGDNNPTDETCWKTCIVLPFRSKEGEAFPVGNLSSMFSSFHPSLLLFLHRLKCIKFRNILNDSLIVMRKQVVKDGIVHVFLGKEKFTWFVKSRTLQACHIRHDVQTTKISMALMLEDLGNGNDIPKLDKQPVFALFPSRSYGLKFIIQADFVVCSSREEVDEHSPWNQWLLLEFSNMFVNAELSFCSLPCFKKNPAKGVSVFMSFVPLEGEVHGFFSQLPHMIISKLCSSSCLLLQGEDNEWVPPCKVLRNWTEQTRSLLPDSLIRKHLDVGYLNEDTLLTDSLAQALGIEECGPKVLIQVMASLCRADSLKSMGLSWLSSWLNGLFLMLVNATESDFISSLSQLPIIPLLDGTYASINEGAIWLHTDPEHGLETFRKLYSKLRIVNPEILNDHVENITQMLYKIGVQRLSAHDALKVHILPAVCDENVIAESTELTIEYLSFIMFHLESSSCSECLVEKKHILSQLRNKAFISTNHGFKRLVDVPIHFGKEFENPIDISRLVGSTDMKWFEIDISYLKHPVYNASPTGTLIWRKFLQELGVTDFVQIVKVEKSVEDICHTTRKHMILDDGWDSQELMHLLSHVSETGDKEKGVYLLKVLDTLWDGYFSEKPYKSYVLRILHSFRWLASSMDDQLHIPKDLFHNCETVRDILGHRAPYTVPKVRNVKFLNDVGLKKTITLDVALSILDVWRGSKKPFRARISQMTKFYTYLWSEMGVSNHKIVETLHSQAFIFVPHSFDSTNEVVSGLLLTPSEVYWHDSTGSMDQKTLTQGQLYEYMTHRVFSKMLSSVYPGLHHFFVNEFGVAESPPLLSYLPCLLQLSTENLPSLAAKIVFQVFKKWSDGLDSGVLSSDDIDYLKKSMKEKEMRILPTEQDKWVSLHQSFDHICWCDDEQLRKEFMNLNNIDFLCLRDLTNEEKQMLHYKVSVLFRRLGIPCLSEVVTREVIHCGLTDSSYTISLVRWALPYAQRYIYRMHPNEYSQLKISGFKKVNSLKIVVVEKLCQKYAIKSFGIESKERDCCCLLQDNILYATHKSDSHSLFMELSHFLLVGPPLANFLFLITTKAQSGFKEEDMELFVTNNQKLPNLPCEELWWSLASTSSPEVESTTTNKKLGKNSSWPPVHWKTAPRLDKTTNLDAAEGLFESTGDWIIDENPSSTMPLVILEDDDKGKNIVSVPPQHVITGREGERAAFNYFSSTLSDKKVKWVNEAKESGLPYDILVEGKDKSQEYIEVKSTSAAKKDWFYISMNEWKFAVEKGESFIIARVVLSDGKLPKITSYRNPAKLLQSRHLQLAFHPSSK